MSNSTIHSLKIRTTSHLSNEYEHGSLPERESALDFEVLGLIFTDFLQFETQLLLDFAQISIL